MSFTPAFQKVLDQITVLVEQGTDDIEIQNFFKNSCRDLGPWERLNNLYKIRPKTPVAGERERLAFFQPNLMQQIFWENHTTRDLVLKMRQGGVTTFSCLIALDKALWEEGTYSAIMADTKDHVKEYFNITKRAFKTFKKDWGAFYKVTENVDNVNALRIEETNSSLLVCTDARGLSLDFLHIAEAAFIEDAKISDSIEAVPLIGWVILETTADGASGLFYDLWDQSSKDKDSLYKPHFFPWWVKYPEEEQLEIIRARVPKNISYSDKEKRLMEENNLNELHIVWRRLKLSESKQDEGEFNRKYPEDPMSCFLSGDSSIFPPYILVGLWKNEYIPAFIGDLIQN